MITIFHNSRCQKSRNSLKALENHTSNFVVKNYLKEDAFTVESLTKVLLKLKKKPEDIIRKQEAVYKSKFKGKVFSDEEWVEILVSNPKLIQRPIIMKDEKAVIGDPVENIHQLF